MNLPRATPLLAALLLANPAAASDLIDIDWRADGRFERELTVPAGKFAEVCGKLAANATVAWRFEAAAPLDFNIHFHEGKKVEYPEKRAGVSQASGSLKVAAPQDYCWMWRNKTAGEARLTLSLRRE